MVTCFYSMGCQKNQESWVKFIVNQNFSYIFQKDRFNMFSFNFQIPVQVKYFWIEEMDPIVNLVFKR